MGEGEDALLEAAKQGATARVRRLLAAGADPGASDRRGWTPLRWACAESHVPVVRLLAPRAGLAALSRCLHVAVVRDRPLVVKALLAAGARGDARDDDDRTPVVLAARDGKTAILAALLGAPGADASRDQALVEAAAGGHAAAVELLLAAGARPDFVTPRGNSALGLARKRRHREVVALLAGHGARTATTSRATRVVPAPPALAAGSVDESLRALLLDLQASTSAKRRAAARKVTRATTTVAGSAAGKARRGAAVEHALLVALARELQDVRPWETQVELARALGAWGASPRTAAWLEQVALEIAFEATMVPAALGGAAARVGARSDGATTARLLRRAVGAGCAAEQRLAVVWGVAEAAADLGATVTAATRRRVEGFLAAPGPVPRDGRAMIANARRAWRALDDATS